MALSTLTERIDWLNGWLEANCDSVAEARSEAAAFGDGPVGSGALISKFNWSDREVQRLEALRRRIEG